MMKIVSTDNAPAAIGPYSQAIVANGFVFCAGQVGRVPGTKNISQDVAEQTHQVLKNITEVLNAAGSDLAHVVKTTIYLTSMKDYGEINKVYAEYFTATKSARSTVEVSALPQGDLVAAPRVEIEAIAVFQ